MRILGVVAAALVAAYSAVTLTSTHAANGLVVSVLGETPTSITLGWTPPAGIAGYEFKVDGTRVSSTWRASQSSVKFGKPAGSPHVYTVVVVVEGVGGDVTSPAPPPPTTTSQPPFAGMPQQGISMPLGNITGKSSADQDWMLDQIKALGNGHPMFLRTDWWPGSTAFDGIAAKAKARGLTMMPILNYDPGNRPTVAAYANAAAMLASLGYRYINLLNEPDMSGWAPADAASYFQAGKAAIKQVEPDAVVIGPSIWKTHTQNPADGFAWTKAFLDAGGRPDVFDIHLYGFVSGDRNWNNWAWLPDYRASLDAHGLAGVPIITSEAGDNANANGNARQDDAVITGMCARDKGCVSHGYTVTVPVASFLDYSLLNDASPGGFGLYDSNRVQRPAYGSFQARSR